MIGTNEENNVIKVYYIHKNYTITYELNNGALEEEKTNPTSYQVTSENITLNNPKKLGYTFLGWTGGVIDENGEFDETLEHGTTGNLTTNTETVIIEKGSIGNRKYIANWRANTDTRYTVEHYFENLDGEYVKDDNETENLQGETDSTVTATAKQKPGYTENTEIADRIPSGTIKADGTLVLKLYYDLNTYKLKLMAGANIKSVGINEVEIETGEEPEESIEATTVIEKEYKVGKEIDIIAELDEEEHYIFEFIEWESSNEELVANQTRKDTKITMPIGDITLIATASKRLEEVEYTINYYYQNVKDETKTITSKINYGTSISSYPAEPKDGYEFKEAKVRENENLPLIVIEDNTQNVINVYYEEKEYNIQYDLVGGALTETNPTTYKISTESFTLNNPTKTGYTFAGWTGGTINEEGNIDDTLPKGTTGNIAEDTPQSEVIIEKGSIGNRKYTANWTPRTDTLYHIEHYFEELDGTYKLNEEETEEKQGTTGELAVATAHTYEGYTEDTTNENRKVQGTIEPDGSLVLKFYYNRNSYKLTLVAGDYIEKVGYKNVTKDEERVDSEGRTIEQTFKFGTLVNIYSEYQEITGYNVIFDQWKSYDTTLVPDQTDKNDQIVMPKGDIKLEAIANKQKANFKYQIRYYYDNEEDEERRIQGTEEYEKHITTYETKEKEGYEFDRAEGTPLQITENEGTNIIKVYYKLINYQITYNLDGGTLGTDEEDNEITNKETYTIKDENFTLNNPQKDEYIFLGWTGSNGDTPQKQVEVNTGDLEDKEYTANWEKIIYKVTVHHYLTGTEEKVAEDEVFSSENLGEAYTTDDLIPEVDEEGNITETDKDERAYLDPIEFLLVDPQPENATGVFEATPIEVIYYYDYTPVVEVVSSPVASLVGTQYNRISLAIQKLEENGLTRSSEPTILKLLRNSRNESTTIEDQNVIFDLAGYTARAEGTTPQTRTMQETRLLMLGDTNEIKPTFKLINTKLIIIDESKAQTGKVINETSVGVYVDIQSEFTLGKEAKPIKQTPQIIGKTSGIEKETVGILQGTFNFYDGKIIGDIAIKGKVDQTPIVYSPSVSDGASSEQIAVLAIINDVEARIGKKLYTKIEDAIADVGTKVGTDGSQVEIIVVRDLSKQNTVVIDKTKNIKLNLDGNNITTTSSGYLIENYGELEIINGELQDDYVFYIEAENTNLVDATQVTSSSYSGGKYVGNTKDINFTFTVPKTGKYDFKTYGGNMNRATTIYIDDEPVANISEAKINIATATTITINLDDIQEGEHTLRLYEEGELGPDYDYFKITPRGKIYSTTSSVIFNGHGQNIDLSTAQDIGDYSFEFKNGQLVSNNKGIDNSTAKSCIEIDLTDLSGVYNLVVNADISSQNGGDYGYATIKTSDIIAPDYSDTAGRFIYVSNVSLEQDYSTTLTGGQKYYLYLGYRKDGSTNSNLDCFIIRNIRLIVQEESTEKQTIDLSTIQKVSASDEYYFEYTDGKLISNNQGHKDTYAYGYIELDLTDKKGRYQVKVDADISNYNNSSYTRKYLVTYKCNKKHKLWKNYSFNIWKQPRKILVRYCSRQKILFKLLI